MKFAVFVSGNGTNLQAIINAVKKKEIKAELTMVFADNRKAYALTRAKSAGIKTVCLLRKDYGTPQSYERDIVIHLKEEGIDLVVLAGFMSLLSPFFVKTFPNKIINIHPTLLPAFKGKNGIKDTFTYGAKIAGATVHFVDEMMDHGPIILQAGFKIPEKETLATLTEHIHKVEYKIFPKAIALFAEGRLKVTGRKVQILDKPQK